ncbi:MAG: ATP-dependent DNA ligase [Kofleriaceae bacterium]
MLFERITLTSGALAATSGRKKKVELIATLLRDVPVEERAIAARFLSGDTGRKLGVGYAIVHELGSAVPPAAVPTLHLIEVDRRFAEIAGLAGAGSSTARKDRYGALLALATAAEQRILGAIVLGELRQGALEALVVDALAIAADVPNRAVRSAYMLAGDLGVVAEAVLADGAAGAARFGLTLFRPILPMLAQTAEDPAEALAMFGGPAALELKLDGFRVQLHKDGDQIRAFSRALNDVTATVPEVIAAVRALPAQRLILDGEALVYGPTGRPLPFQDTMRQKSESGRGLTLSLFDLLLVDDQTLLSQPARDRFAMLGALAPAHAVPRVVTGDAAEATAFYERAIAAGHEGVMAKALDAPYDAGNRGAAWLKIKRVLRLDLVILAVEWGSGRRKGLLSNLHLGARDPAGGFVMLGKTFKGLTDAVLAWQTAELLAREVDRDRHIIYVRPELVAEIAFNDVLRSTQYPGGLALRHARLVRYRSDKTASEADTIDAVRAIAVADGVI